MIHGISCAFMVGWRSKELLMRQFHYLYHSDGNDYTIQIERRYAFSVFFIRLSFIYYCPGFWEWALRVRRFAL